MCKVYTRQRQTKAGYSWEWRFEAPRLGKKRSQISKSGYHSESEALAAGYAEFNRIKAEGAVSETSLTMNELLVEYTEKMLFPGLSKGTADNYRALIANRISPAIGTLRLSEITSGKILDMYNSIRLHGVSQFPLEGIKRILGGAFEYARTMGYLTSDHMDGIRFPKSISKPSEKTAYTPQQINVMAESLPPTNDRRLPFLIATYTGMRESEIAGLTWNDVDMENQIICVKEQLHCNGAEMYFGPTKNGIVRYIPFRGSLAEILKEARERKAENENLLGDRFSHPVRRADGRVSYSTNTEMGKQLDMVCTKADGRCLASWDFKAISTAMKNRFDPDFTFHLLRHSHCTTALDAGASVKAVADRLGHKDIRTTLSVYAHVSPQLRSETAEIVESRFTDDSLKLVHTA